MISKQKKIIEDIKKYFINLYSKKNIIWKLCTFFIAAIIIVIPFFSIRSHMLNAESITFPFMGNFVEGSIISNTGVGFSFGNENIPLAYSLQSIFSLIPLAIFIASPSKLMDIGSSFMFIGGFSNLIDRATPDHFVYLFDHPDIVTFNAVVDYWRFGFMKSGFIFNYADVFIVSGSIILGISLIIFFVAEIKKENKKEEKNKNENIKI